MGIFDRGKKSFKCSRNLENGKLTCESFRVNRDGTKESLAKVIFDVDGNCNTIQEDSEESEEGELAILTKKVTPTVIDKCMKSSRGGKPSDY